LRAYQQVLQHKEVFANDSPEQVELLLSGLLIKCDGLLKVRNRIYQAVFNLDWVEQQLEKVRPAHSWATLRRRRIKIRLLEG
jgi:hypothetical protein